jgi:hypothetical protein
MWKSAPQKITLFANALSRKSRPDWELRVQANVGWVSEILNQFWYNHGSKKTLRTNQITFYKTPSSFSDYLVFGFELFQKKIKSEPKAVLFWICSKKTKLDVIEQSK